MPISAIRRRPLCTVLSCAQAERPQPLVLQDWPTTFTWRLASVTAIFSTSGQPSKLCDHRFRPAAVPVIICQRQTDIGSRRTASLSADSVRSPDIRRCHAPYIYVRLHCGLDPQGLWNHPLTQENRSAAMPLNFQRSSPVAKTACGLIGRSAHPSTSKPDAVGYPRHPARQQCACGGTGHRLQFDSASIRPRPKQARVALQRQSHQSFEVLCSARAPAENWVS